MCSLFSDRPAHLVADRMHQRLLGHGVRLYRGAVPSDFLQVLLDAHRVLRGTPRSHLLPLLADALAREELLAAMSARPTPGAADVARALAGSGRLVSVASNNAAAAVEHYLERFGLLDCFGGRLHGRSADPALMKPHPDVLLRVLESTGGRPGECLLVGDSPSDYQAAAAMRMPFLGYARDEKKAALLREAGARDVISSWDEVLEPVALG